METFKFSDSLVGALLATEDQLSGVANVRQDAAAPRFGFRVRLAVGSDQLHDIAEQVNQDEGGVTLVHLRDVPGV